MKLNDRINIIVTQNDDESLVWESPAGNTAGQVKAQAINMISGGRFNKVFIGSISSSSLTEVKPRIDRKSGSIKNSAGVRFKAKPVVEEIEITDAGLDRIADDIFDEAFPFVREFNKFKHDVGWGEEKAKQHAREVAQAEKVEKYKRDLLNSREARFYKRFRELGATHEQAVKYAWGE